MLYTVNVEGQSPLAIQLTAGTVGLWVRSWDAFGANEQGVTGRPSLYRPSVAGTSRATAETAVISSHSSPLPANPQATVITSFATFPSFPEPTGQTTSGLPYRASAEGLDMWVPAGESAVLYAGTDFEGSVGQNPGDAPIVHAWHATLTWEEPA